MRLINADALDFEGKGICEIVEMIDDAPAVDAVEVTYCRNCIYYHPNDRNDDICHRAGGMTEPADDDFCSLAAKIGKAVVG